MVEIILFNSSSLISELILLALENIDSNIVEIDSNQPIPKDSYDLLIIDDSYGDSSDIGLLIERIDAKHKILLSSSEDIFDGVTKTLLKPFLPKDIEKIVEDSMDISSAILDLDEIQSIKDILDGELLTAPTITKKEKKKREKSSEVEYLLQELLSMKSKKIKKILEGVKINISIEFPRGEK